MNREGKFLTDSATSEELYLILSTDEPERSELCCVVCARLRLRLKSIKVQDVVVRTHGAVKASELGLSADEWGLSSFKAESSALAYTRLLTFGTTTGGRAGSRCISSGNALALLCGSPVWLESM